MYPKKNVSSFSIATFLRRFIPLSLLIFSYIPSALSSTKITLPKDREARVIKFFNSANFSNMKSLCEKFYHPKIIFDDPLGTIEGRSEMIKYYLNLYQNVVDIKFDFKDSTKNNSNSYMFSWVMYLKTKSLKSGEEIKLEGVSHLKFDPKTNLVIYHRDYFDMGAFIYEHIPLVGSLIRYIKRKLSSH